MCSTGGSNGDTWNMARCVLQEAVMETLGTWHGVFYDKFNGLFNGKLNGTVYHDIFTCIIF